MSDTVTKRLNVSDVITFPYEANKSWGVPSSSFNYYGIFFKQGIYPTASNISNYTEENLLYKSVLVNYYPEFYPTYSHSTSSYNQTINYNLSLTTASYNGFQLLGNQATTYKWFPTNSSSVIYTINIPTSLYSGKIIPTTFEMQVNGGKIYDDGEYNLRWSGSGTYLLPSGSSLIRLNSGSLPYNLHTFSVSGSVYEINSRISNNTFAISTSLYLNSSSYTLNYYTSSQVTGSDLTMYTIQTDTTSAFNIVTSAYSTSSNTLRFSSSIATPWTFTAGPIPPPPANLSDSFGGGPPYLTVLTITTGSNYFAYGTSSLNYAYVQSITGSIDTPPFYTSVVLSPGYTLVNLPPTGSTVTLLKTSQSYQPSTVVTQSSMVFDGIIVSESGSLTIGSTNYPIVNRIDAVTVQLATPLLYTTPTPFTLNYTSSNVFNSSSVSSGGLITVSSPNVSSSINTLLTQSSYVGNIFYEQGLGVLTVVPVSIIP